MTIEEFGRRLALWVLRHRFATIVACLLSCAAMGAGLPRAQFSTDYRIFFSEADPQRQALDRLEKVFTKTDNVVFVVRSAEGDVFERHTLSAVQALTEAGWKLPYASRVDSIANYQHSYAEEEDIVVEPLIAESADSLSRDRLAQLRATAMGEELLVGALLSRDGATTGVNVTLRLPGHHPKEVTEVAEAARALAADVNARFPAVQVRVSGMALMNDAFMEASIEDMAFIVPLMYAVMIVAMVVLLRSVVATAAITLVILFSSVVTLGLAGWLAYPLTPPSAAAPTIVLTLAIADGVHLFVSTRAGMQDGLSQRDAIVASMAANLRPVILTSVTTMIGFACLNFAEAPPYWHLANMTTLGVGAALVYSVTLLPSLVSLIPIRVPPRRARSVQGMDGFGRAVVRGRHAILIGSVVLTLVFGWFASRLTSNDRFLEYFAETIEFRPDTEFMLDNLSGVYTVEYAIGSTGESGVAEPEYLRNLDAFAQWLRAQPEVDHVYSFSDIVKRLHRNMNGDDSAFSAIPEAREVVSQYLLLYEMSLPQGLDLNDRIDIARSSTRVSIVVGDLSSRQMREFKARSEAWLVDNTPEYMHTEATSPVVIFAHLADRNTEQMMVGNVWSLLLISACLVVGLRSPRLGLLSIIPNVVPIVIGYGIWYLLLGEINIVASVAGTICLGIIVDDTIHFLSKYQQARERGLNGREAVRTTFIKVGPAMVATTVILVFGFGVLTQSGFQMNSHLGALVVIVVTLALLADMMMLPALLVLLDRRSVRTPSHRELP